LLEAGTRDPRPRDERPAVRHQQAGPFRAFLAALLAVPVLGSIYVAAVLRRAAFLRPGASHREVELESLVDQEHPARVERAGAFQRPARIERPVEHPLRSLRPAAFLRHAAFFRPAAFLRPALVVAVGGLLTLGSYGPAPVPLKAAPQSPQQRPAAQPTAVARVGAAVVTGQGLVDALHFDFTSPMDAATVLGALTIDPATELRFAWSEGGRILQVMPAPAWQPGTAYTLTIGAAARDMQGLAMASPVTASFLTREPVAARLAMSVTAAKASPLAPMVLVTFSRPVMVSSVGPAIRVSPAVAGTLSATGGTSRGLGTRFAWRPRQSLRPGTSYTFSLSGAVVDEDGLRVPAGARLVLSAPRRPAIVRHRPAADASDVPREALLSVRFTERMDRRSTERAFAIAGMVATRQGSFGWFEGDTVLAYDPRAALAAGRRYTVTIAGSARSARGVPLGTGSDPAMSFSFRVAGAGSTSLTRTPSKTGSGGSAATGWPGVERYVLGLVNCIRTGGTLQSDGDCIGYGSGRNGGYARPLTVHAGISTKVARPYARYLAVRAACNHFLDGNPGFRLRRSGYTSYRWAENLGCRSGNPYTAVLGSHLYFQSEKSYGGGHWVNLKNPLYTTVGIGVWVSNGNVRVVTDFYDP
jgi:Big-like domain-containing protein